LVRAPAIGSPGLGPRQRVSMPLYSTTLSSPVVALCRSSGRWWEGCHQLGMWLRGGEGGNAGRQVEPCQWRVLRDGPSLMGHGWNCIMGTALIAWTVGTGPVSALTSWAMLAPGPWNILCLVSACRRCATVPSLAQCTPIRTRSPCERVKRGSAHWASAQAGHACVYAGVRGVRASSARRVQGRQQVKLGEGGCRAAGSSKSFFVSFGTSPPLPPPSVLLCSVKQRQAGGAAPAARPFGPKPRAADARPLSRPPTHRHGHAAGCVGGPPEAGQLEAGRGPRRVQQAVLHAHRKRHGRGRAPKGDGEAGGGWAWGGGEG